MLHGSAHPDRHYTRKKIIGPMVTRDSDGAQETSEKILLLNERNIETKQNNIYIMEETFKNKTNYSRKIYNGG